MFFTQRFYITLPGFLRDQYRCLTCPIPAGTFESMIVLFTKVVYDTVDGRNPAPPGMVKTV